MNLTAAQATINYHGPIYSYHIILSTSRRKPISLPLDILGDDTRLVMPSLGTIVPARTSVPKYNQTSRSLTIKTTLVAKGRIPIHTDMSSSAGMLMFANDHGISLGNNPLSDISFDATYGVEVLMTLPAPINSRPGEELTLFPTIIDADIDIEPELNLMIGQSGPYGLFDFSQYADSDPKLFDYLHNLDNANDTLIPDIVEYYSGLTNSDYQFQCRVTVSRTN